LNLEGSLGNLGSVAGAIRGALEQEGGGTLDQIVRIDRKRRRIEMDNGWAFKLGQVNILDGRLLAKLTVLRIEHDPPGRREAYGHHWLYLHDIPAIIRKGHYVTQH
jgi:hypothetical protein